MQSYHGVLDLEKLSCITISALELKEHTDTRTFFSVQVLITTNTYYAHYC